MKATVNVFWFFRPTSPLLKYSMSDQSRRYSARRMSPCGCFTSAVIVNSLRFCAAPLAKPSVSSKISKRGASANTGVICPLK